jgi:hypothetical protein
LNEPIQIIYKIALNVKKNVSNKQVFKNPLLQSHTKTGSAGNVMLSLAKAV